MKELLIRGAVFDMDGTLLDSMAIWEHYASSYLRGRGILPPADIDEVLSTFTLAEAAVYLRERFALPESAEEIVAGFDRTVDALYEHVAPKPGIPALLSLFAEHGVPMALATMTDRPAVLRVLDRLGLLSYFSHIFTCAEVGARKNRPTIYEAALAALGTKREETVVFEDAFYAIKTAATAGFPVVAIYDPCGEKRWEKACATATLAVRDVDARSFLRYLPGKS